MYISMCTGWYNVQNTSGQIRPRKAGEDLGLTANINNPVIFLVL